MISLAIPPAKNRYEMHEMHEMHEMQNARKNEAGSGSKIKNQVWTSIDELNFVLR